MRPADTAGFGPVGTNGPAVPTPERPFWPTVELWKAVNGWIVQPTRGFDRTTTVASEKEVYVFRDWSECAKFLAEVTEPRRANNGRAEQT